MLANLITLSRIIFGAITGYFIINNQISYALVTAIIGALTDFFDGIIARRTKTTITGQILDPIADKTFAGLIIIAFIISGKLTLTETTLFLTKDILTLPLLYKGIKKPKLMKARPIGKILTTLQFAFIITILMNLDKKYLLYSIVTVGIIAAGDYYKLFLSKRNP